MPKWQLAEFQVTILLPGSPPKGATNYRAVIVVELVDNLAFPGLLVGTDNLVADKEMPDCGKKSTKNLLHCSSLKVRALGPGALVWYDGRLGKSIVNAPFRGPGPVLVRPSRVELESSVSETDMLSTALRTQVFSGYERVLFMLVSIQISLQVSKEQSMCLMLSYPATSISETRMSFNMQ